MATPYEVLRVRPDAAIAEIRRAYLNAARQNHPDVAGPSGDERMREINQAWAVLSDPEARRRLDDMADPGSSTSTTTTARGFTVNPIDDRPFVPFDAEDDDDSWRFEPDEFDPATAPSMAMKFLPVSIFASAVLLGILGVVTSAAPLLAAAVVLGVLGCASFMVAPMVAMGKASANELRKDP